MVVVGIKRTYREMETNEQAIIKYCYKCHCKIGRFINKEPVKLYNNYCYFDIAAKLFSEDRAWMCSSCSNDYYILNL
jgi:hypothetical protein